VERISHGATDGDANELLAEVYNGYPVTNLRQLLHSEEENAIKAGVWIASELGEIARPLLSEISRLLRHSLRYVRFCALDAVLLIAFATDGEVIAEAIRLLDDADEAVRWKTMHFLSKATPNQLRSSLPYTTDIRMAALVKWLLDATSARRLSDVLAAIDDPERRKRFVAAAAAARMSDHTLAPLQQAASSRDLERWDADGERADRSRDR